jgi:hypothetical protein
MLAKQAGASPSRASGANTAITADTYDLTVTSWEAPGKRAK